MGRGFNTCIVGIERYKNEITKDMVSDMLSFYYVGDWDVNVEFYDRLDSVGDSIQADAGVVGTKKARVRIMIENIRDVFAKRIPIGGNVTVPQDMTCAILFALRHEIQHLNQYFLSGNTLSQKNVAFDRSTKYRGRPCEVDARAAVDRSEDEIIALAGA